jgi:hypothetical protein
MIPRPRTVALAFLGFVVWAVVALWVVTSNSMLESPPDRERRAGRDGGEQAREAARARTRARETRKHERERARAAEDPEDDGGGGHAPVVGLGGGAVLVALGLVRRTARRRRPRVRVRVLPHRADPLGPDQVEAVLCAWHEALQEAPLRGRLLGAPAIGLELATAPDGEGGAEAALSLVCPAQLLPVLETALVERCPDVRLLPAGWPAPPSHAVRVPPPAPWGAGAAAPARPHARDLLAAMAATGEPAVVHLALTPARAPRRRRGRVMARPAAPAGAGAPFEPIAIAQADAGAPFEPTASDAATATAADFGVMPVHGAEPPASGPVFRTELRVAAGSPRACAAIAGALAAGRPGAETAGPRTRRLRSELGAPGAGRRHPLRSAADLAAVWHAPAGATGAVRVPCSAVPRLPAPARVSRIPEDELLRDERGPVGLAAADRRDGLAAFGAGARAILERCIARDAPDAGRVLVVVCADAGATDRAAALIAPHREAVVVRLDRPATGLNPLATGGEPEALAAAVVDAIAGGLPEPLDDAAARAARQAVAATIAGARAGVLGEQPSLALARRVLEPSGGALRERLARALYTRPRAASLATFAGREVAATLREPAGPDAAALDAARRALAGTRAQAADRLLGCRSQVALDAVADHRAALVLDASGGELGPDDRAALARLALAALPGVLADGAATLVLGGADAIVDARLARELAGLRAGGLELVTGWRYAGLLATPEGRTVALELAAHRCLLGLGGGDAETGAALCAQAAGGALGGRAALVPEAILAMPAGYAVCSWAPGGARRETFVARAVPAGA